ncbi:MAG: HAMP domain-containing histidine kinase [Bacteroidota bacterium]|nr:HAMP domain-containing histidine kinase [Bacteroidota bacterium]
MKLLSKYNRINIPIIIGVLLLSGFVYYYMLHVLLLHQLNHDLEIEEQEIREFVKNNDSLPHASIYKDQQISFDTLLNKVPPRKFTTEEFFSPGEKENELYRQLTFPITVKNRVYQAIVKKSQEETEYLIKTIVRITLLIIILLLVVLIIVNRFVLRKLWMPFHSTVEQLKQFNISSKNKLQLNYTNITEFEELNKTAAVMTDKVSSDYETLKNFTENASHEIQTPLAIMKMKLELLMQSENMNAMQVDCISALNEATDRLSRLNQSLLLLTKIDNSQFIDVEKVDLSDILLHHINNYEELANAKNISIKKNISLAVHLLANRSLMEILISNIMTNTIKHNYKNGWIEINLSGNSLSVSNTGKEPSVNTNELFERFRKSDATADSLGLGLAIVKKICDTCGFDVAYNYDEPMHTIVINFEQDNFTDR